MPWTSIGSVPPQVKTHKGIPLTLTQANKWASIYDSIKGNPDLENPAAVAWSTWEKMYIIKDGKWADRKDSKQSYECECLKCGKKVTTTEHCTDIKCPDCGGEMRRTERPGPGKEIERKFMEEVLFITDSALKVSSIADENSIVHGVAVSLNVSNNHRFPEDVLDRDIGTLIGQPLVEGHSMWPMDVEVKDMYGMVIDAWYNRVEKRAEFYAEVWDENYKTVLEKMPHRVKFSVGFKHDFDVEKDEDTIIHVSNSAFFDHIGTTNRPADTDSVLLGIKQDAEARGCCVKMEGKNIIVVEPFKVDNEGGNNMPDGNEEIKPEVEGVTPPVEPPVEPPAEEETPPESEPETPPVEPPAPDNEPEDAGDDEATEKFEKRLEETNTALKVEQDKRKELESKVQAFEREVKRAKVEAYVDQLVDEKVRVPSQKDALVDQYLSYSEEQMKREMEINQVSADLSELFGEKAIITESDEDDKVPDRKTIT